MHGACCLFRGSSDIQRAIVTQLISPMTTAALLRAGAALRPAPAALAALSLRPVARSASPLLQLQRRGLAGHSRGSSATSVTVRAVAAERPAAPAPASFSELGVIPELQVRGWG